MNKAILLIATYMLATSCQTTKFTNYYRELGRLDCEVAKSLQEGINHQRLNSDDTTETNRLMKIYDDKVNAYQIYTDKYWDLEAKIKSEFTEEHANFDYLEGYKECNCDTCIFYQESLSEPAKKKALKPLKQI